MADGRSRRPSPPTAPDLSTQREHTTLDTEPSAIGVVGGMGPYAGTDLVRTIFDETRAQTDQDHLPVVLISFPGAIPDRSAFLADPAAPSPIEPIADLLLRLERAGCAVAGVPCNTAHAPAIMGAVADAIRARGSRLQIISIVDACAASVREVAPRARRIGILATPATIDLDVYGGPLREAGLEPLAPEPEVQAETVTPAIFDPKWGLKAQGNPATREARTHLLDAIRHLRSRGAEAVILGCTELPLALPEPEVDGIRLISSTRALARALIRARHADRLRRP